MRNDEEHQTGGEGADDQRRPGDLGEHRESEGKGEPEHPQRARRLDALDDTERRRGDAHPDQNSTREKEDRDRADLPDMHRVDTRTADQICHYGENHETDDIVEHCRAEYDAPFGRLQAAEIGEHARRDPD